MSNTLSCPRCHAEVQFEDEDRGTDAYCDSCGGLVSLPLASEAAPPAETETTPPSVTKRVPSRRSSVFAEMPESAAVANTKFSCPSCKAKNPVSLDDLGTTIYCCGCGAAITVGAELGKAEKPKTPTKPSVATTRTGRTSKQRTVLYAGVCGLLVVGLLFAILFLPLGSDELSGVGNTLASTGSQSAPPPGAGSMGTKGAKATATTGATPGGSGQPSKKGEPTASHASTATATGASNGPASSGPTSGNPPEETAAEPETDRGDAEITLTAIEKLLASQDAEAALIQAQVWQQQLTDEKVADEDPRKAALQRVIDTLIARLAPVPKPDPPYVAEFEKLLKAVQENLLREAVVPARKDMDQADALYEAHPEELARFSRRYRLLKQTLQDLEADTMGVTMIEEGLTRSQSLAEEGKVSEAILELARAKYRTQRTPTMTEAEFQRIDANVRSLAPIIRLARAKRAIDDAEECAKSRPASARDRQVALARALLPGLPEATIAPLLTRLDAVEKRTITSMAISSLGQTIELRALCEEGIEQFGGGDLAKLSDRYDAAWKFAQAAPADVDKQPLTTLRDCMTVAVNDRLNQCLAKRDDDPELAAELLAMKKFLDQVAKSLPRSTELALKMAVDQRCRDLVASIVGRGAAEAAKGNYSKAIADAESALPFADADDKAALVKDIDVWKKEQQFLEDRKAMESAIADIRQLSEKGSILDACAELSKLEQRFPNSDWQTGFDSLRQELEPTLRGKFDEILSSLDKAYEKEDFVRFRSEVAKLDLLPKRAAEQARIEALQKKAKDLQLRAEGLFAEIEPYSKMLDEGQTIEVIRRIPRVLLLAPDFEKAQVLAKRAQSAGRFRAEKLTRSLRFLEMQADKTVYRNRLVRIAALDPEGEFGTKANLLLRALNAS